MNLWNLKSLLILLLLTAYCLLPSGGRAQDKPKPVDPAKSEVQRLDLQSHPDVAEAQRQAYEARLAAELAKAQYETAQQRLMTAVYKAMADMKLSTKEWRVKDDPQGGILFEKIIEQKPESKKPQ